MPAGRVRNRRAAVGAAAVLLLWPLAASTAFASTDTVSGSDRAAAVQTVLDRVLGPGNSTVVVSDTVQTSSSQTTSVQWGTGVAAAVARTTVAAPGGTSVTTAQQNLDGSTTTVLTTPAGSLVTRSVSVAVDRAHLGSTSLATIKQLITASAGIVPARGDRVSVVVARFARRTAVSAVAVSPLAALMPFAVPAIWLVGAVAAVSIVAASIRGGRRRARPGTDVVRA